LVVIPTTAGTGSEVTIAAMVYDSQSHAKLAFSDKFLLPNLAVLDPELTLSMPPLLTAATAMDALTHGIEAFVSLQSTPYSDALAEKAIQLIFSSLLAAVEDGKDLGARGALQIASNMAGAAFSHAMVGCIHGMAHALGGMCRVPHGTANAILLPHGMEYNFDEVGKKYARLAPILGEETKGVSDEEAGRRVIAAVRKLNEQLKAACGLPTRLRDVGVPQEKLTELAEAAVQDGTSFYNPRMMTADEIHTVLQTAY
jgi:alcohol dehydrogenase class IV